MSEDSMNYKVKANEFSFSITRAEINDADIVQLSSTEFNLLKDHHCVTAKVSGTAPGCKNLNVEIEGETFMIEIKDELDQVLEKMGFGQAANKQVKQIKAPMPGLVLEIAVIDGQDVKEGDKILILEAMKMENSIMIHVQARIKNVVVSAGQAVEKGQVLVELE